MIYEIKFRKKSSSLNQREDEDVADGLSEKFIEISNKMDFHNYVNKEITFVRSNDIMRYARGKHRQINIG